MCVFSQNSYFILVRLCDAVRSMQLHQIYKLYMKMHVMMSPRGGACVKLRVWCILVCGKQTFTHLSLTEVSHKDQICCKYVYVSAATLELMGTNSLLEPDSSGPKRNCRFLLLHCF